MCTPLPVLLSLLTGCYYHLATTTVFTGTSERMDFVLKGLVSPAELSIELIKIVIGSGQICCWEIYGQISFTVG